MNNQETFHKLIQLISQTISIPTNTIMSSSKHCEVIDARYMLVNLLHKNGLYPSQIAELLQQTPTNVRRMINLYDIRLSTNKQFAYNAKNVQKAFENNFFLL